MRGCRCTSLRLCDQCAALLARVAAAPMDPPPPPLSEARFLAIIRQTARRLGWRTYHTHNSRKSERGFPDLCLVRAPRAQLRPRLVFAELKMPGETPTLPQREWIADLSTVPGIECYLWYPDDLQDIVQILRVS